MMHLGDNREQAGERYIVGVVKCASEFCEMLMRSRGDLSSTPVFLQSCHVVRGAFHLEAPPPAHPQSLNPSHSHVHHSYMSDAAHTIHTGRFGRTLTHTSHEALCFGFAAEIKPGSVTFLYKGDKERLSRIQLVCLCACVFVPACVFIGENVCIVFSGWCHFYFYPAIFFFFLFELALKPQ